MKLLAVDGNSLINRAYYGVPILTSKSGEFTNAVYGFINMLNHIIELESFDGVAVAFDLKKPTFRHKMYKEYKAGRKPMPEELFSQFPKIKEWITLMGYTVLECEGFEADDILGTLGAIAEKSDNECFIATGDRDSFQLVSKNVTVLHTVTKMGKPQIIRYTPEVILEKYGVTPKQMIDIKALQGDSSDNIPGVPGIGEKTAGTLIKDFGSIENIYKNIDEADIKESLKNKLIAGKESAELSYTLGKICCEVPINTSLQSYMSGKANMDAVASFMTKLDLFSLMSKMGITPGSTAPVKEEKTEEFRECPTEIKDGDSISVMFFSFAAICKDNCVFKLQFTDELFVKIMENGNIKKSVYNCKAAYRKCADSNINLCGVCFDASLAGYLLSPSATGYDLSRLAAEYFAGTPVFNDEVCDELKSVALLSLTDKKLKAQIEDKELRELLNNIELPLARVLASMEDEGFLVDTSGIKAMGEALAKALLELQAEIYNMAGEEFNINSPKQLGEVLFEKLGLPAKKKTKSGYSTNAEVLEGLRNEHAIIDLILDYRKLAKLKSTYCDGLVASADEGGRIHSTLNQTETRTGRISSLEPNLQNIPVKTKEGRELRKYFKAKDGYLLLDADYSQIELRVLASMADDENMINAFNSGADIHLTTAAQVFKLPESMVTPTMRSRAKAVNFGIVYGIGAFSLAKDIGVTRKEAAQYIEGYLSTYSGVANYMDSVVENAKTDGFVTTLFGRRRYLPEITSKNGMLRAFGERVARNMPIQGTAADIIKIAMIKVYNRLKAEKLDAHIIMQVHDELIVEAKESDSDKAAKILSEEMQNAAKLKVPLIADTNIGKTWYDAKG